MIGQNFFTAKMQVCKPYGNNGADAGNDGIESLNVSLLSLVGQERRRQEGGDEASHGVGEVYGVEVRIRAMTTPDVEAKSRATCARVGTNSKYGNK